MQRIISLICLIVTLLTVGCSNSSETPEDVIQKFEDALNQRNLSALDELFSKHFAPVAKESNLIREMISGEEIEEGKINLIIKDKRKEGNFYIITVDAQPDEEGKNEGVEGGIVDMRMVETESGWKIDAFIDTNTGKVFLPKEEEPDEELNKLTEEDVLKIFQFKKNLENIASSSNEGDKKNYLFELPLSYKEVCLINLENHGAIENHWAIADMIENKVEKNVFLLKDQFGESWLIEGIVPQQGFNCFPIINGKISLSFEKEGKKIIVS